MDLSSSLHCLIERIKKAETQYNRPPGSVLLLAVSKQQPIELIQQAAELGLTEFGENYYQEALTKIQQLKHLSQLNWHFIGPIQSNKVKGIAQHFNWVHGISRYSIAKQLNEYRGSQMVPLNVCLQINLESEASKSGISCDDAKLLASQVSLLPHLKLRGLMTIPPRENDFTIQYQRFQKLYNLLHTLNHELGLKMDTLSMGMSDDLEPAIKAGSNLIRIGTALFGERKQS